MAERVRVFVSHHHSSDEDAFTARLVADLEAAGADVWVDTSGVSSDDFVRKISEGLAGRQWLVLVMTPSAVASPWVQREVNAALNEVAQGRMLGVLPLVMRPCRDQDLPVLWRTLHRYDATRDYRGALAGLLSVLRLSTPLSTDNQPVATPAQNLHPRVQPPRQAGPFGSPLVQRLASAGKSVLGSIPLWTKILVPGLAITIAAVVGIAALIQGLSRPHAAFTYSIESYGGNFGENCVQFDASTSTGDSLTYSWDFDDPLAVPPDQQTTGEFVAHCYSDGNTRAVKLTVTTIGGASDTTTQYLFGAGSE